MQFPLTHDYGRKQITTTPVEMGFDTAKETLWIGMWVYVCVCEYVHLYTMLKEMYT